VNSLPGCSLRTIRPKNAGLLGLAVQTDYWRLGGKLPLSSYSDLTVRANPALGLFRAKPNTVALVDLRRK
jgi:hypothetical protein